MSDDSSDKHTEESMGKSAAAGSNSSSMVRTVISNAKFYVKKFDGTLKVCMGNLVVIEGVRCMNLYFLEGSTVLGGVDTSTTVIGESILDTTALVHECFDEDLGKQLGISFGEHCALGRQLGVKFDIAADHFFGKLDFVWGSAFESIVSLGGTYQFGLLVSCSSCFWIYALDFIYGYLLLVEIDRLKTNLGFIMKLGHWFWILGTVDLKTLV
ncbi:hypothetical protein Vadar_004284 [Vaccinium darrowii]|uniref:Uncharacterized protein n=1 Tax=Vaccinium darrowii TaxID=229202 RepID=A0ACB7XGE6_9ERIC|nr:hypothetical protein Vadar_004284 [Vaccinium darrowii]